MLRLLTKLRKAVCFKLLLNKYSYIAVPAPKGMLGLSLLWPQ